jgi:hypothetical protein
MEFVRYSGYFPGNMNIRKTLRHCQQNARRPSRRSSPGFPSLLLLMQAVQDSWMGLVSIALARVAEISQTFSQLSGTKFKILD